MSKCHPCCGCCDQKSAGEVAKRQCRRCDKLKGIHLIKRPASGSPPSVLVTRFDIYENKGGRVWLFAGCSVRPLGRLKHPRGGALAAQALRTASSTSAKSYIQPEMTRIGHGHAGHGSHTRKRVTLTNVGSLADKQGEISAALDMLFLGFQAALETFSSHSAPTHPAVGRALSPGA